MTTLGNFLKKWWVPAALFILSGTPSAVIVSLQNILSPYVSKQSPTLLLNIAALLIWLIMLLIAFKYPWHRWDVPTGTWVCRRTGVRYCAKCRAAKIIVPLKNEVTGWRCMNCMYFFYDPSRENIESPKKRLSKNKEAY